MYAHRFLLWGPLGARLWTLDTDCASPHGTVSDSMRRRDGWQEWLGGTLPRFHARSAYSAGIFMHWRPIMLGCQRANHFSYSSSIFESQMKTELWLVAKSTSPDKFLMEINSGTSTKYGNTSEEHISSGWIALCTAAKQAMCHVLTDQINCNCRLVTLLPSVHYR